MFVIFRSSGGSWVGWGWGEPETCPKFAFHSSLPITLIVWVTCSREAWRGGKKMGFGVHWAWSLVDNVGSLSPKSSSLITHL